MASKTDMEKTIAELTKNGELMGREILTLKRQIGGYKTANERYKKELEKAKAYGKEADELNEQKANRILELEKQLETAIKDVDVARDAKKIANEQIANVCKKIRDLSDEIGMLKANIDWYNNLPWYKKIFVKTI